MSSHVKALQVWKALFVSRRVDKSLPSLWGKGFNIMNLLLGRFDLIPKWYCVLYTQHWSHCWQAGNTGCGKQSYQSWWLSMSVAFDPWCQVHFFIKQNHKFPSIAEISQTGWYTNNRHVSSHSAGGQKSPKSRLAGLIPAWGLKENLFPMPSPTSDGCQQHLLKTLISISHLSGILPYVSLCLRSSSLSYKDTGHWI